MSWDGEPAVSEALDVLLDAATTVGISAPAPELIRAGENHIYRLAPGIVGRVARSGEAASVRRETVVARWLSSSGISAITPLDVDQPIVIDGRAVTFWHELPAHRNGTVRQVAGVLRKLHALPVPDELRDLRLAPFVRLVERISQATNIGEQDRGWLLERVEQLRSAWVSLPPGAPQCVIHGDAWAGNVVEADGLGVTLLDLERCSVGPPEWDLASTAVRYTSFGTMDAAEYYEYCTAYGRDVTTWPGYELLRDIRELRVTCFAIQRAHDDPQLAGEALLRVDCISGKNGPRPWGWTPV